MMTYCPCKVPEAQLERNDNTDRGGGDSDCCCCLTGDAGMSPKQLSKIKIHSISTNPELTPK
jgi:hypothetical protein